MKTRMLMLAVALAFPLTTLAAESTHDGHDAHGKQKLELNAGKKWTTDDALRKGMSSIRTAIATALPAAHSGKVSNAEYDALGKELNTQVVYIVENCKLDPKADAQLHVIVGELMSGIDTVEGKQKKKRAEGVVRVAQALNAYGKHFDHAGWQAISLPH
jgi:hypothetical protein